MNVSKRVLVGTLFSGENELESCIASVQQQNYPSLEQIVIKNLPNKEAHDTLYKTFMNFSHKFDYFIKLDADMVFKSTDAIETMISFFARDPNLDHLEMAVDDRFSNSLIMGVHVFSNRAQWVASQEKLFVDYNPQIPGKHLRLWEQPAPLVDHCPNPSPFQAYHFGVHRALKAFQPLQLEVNYIQARKQWRLLKKVWHHFLQTQDPRLGLCILGAEQVINREIDLTHIDYTNPQLQAKFQEFKTLEAVALEEVLLPTWGNLTKREFRHLIQTIPRASLWIIKKLYGKFSGQNGE